MKIKTIMIMRNIKSIIAVSLLTLSTAAMAQNLQSGYFTDGFLYRHDMNPAIGNDQSYVSMPILGNFNFSTQGNVGVKSFLYDVNGRTATFLHPSVSTEEFLGNINDANKLSQDLRLQILGAGFKSFGGYTTFEINVRENFGLTAPGSLLRAMKEGLQNKTYDFSALGSSASAYAEIALGHSHQINEQLRIGAKVKVLLGIADEKVTVNKGELTLGEDGYKASVDAEVSLAAKEIKFDHDVNENTNHKYVSGIDEFTAGIAGTGFAVDLGAEYKLNDAWKFSAAIVDLGFINYSHSYLASTGGVKNFNTDKYTFNVDDEATNNFDDELDKMVDDLSKLYELEDKGDKGSTKRSLGATVNVGAQFTLPAYDKFSVGLLGTTHMNGDYSWSEARLSANIAPAKFFSAGVNVSAGTYGMGFGWIINLHPNGFNLFMGMDRFLGSVTKQYIPLNSNTSFSMGVNFPF